MENHTGDTVVIIIVVGALAIGLISMAVGQVARLWAWLIDYRPVKHSQQNTSEIMSRSESDDRPVVASSLRQTAPQTDDRPMIAEPTRDEMLDIFRLMRAYGIPREDARPVLKAAGLKLDNNLWSQAAPPEPDHHTPIVDRPTNAKFRSELN